MANLKDINPLLLYTMTSGLGDYIVMGDLMRKIERIIPTAHCLIAHRNNPLVTLWKYDNPLERFFNVYNPLHFFRLVSKLKNIKRKGYTVFGLQMAPGSIQGFFFLTFLKNLKAIDYIVDFNLINADIVTPPIGNYILDLHLNQIKTLFKIRIPEEFYKLKLPIENGIDLKTKADNNHIRIGIHPWSRRGHLNCFTWTHEKWLEVILFLLKNGHEVIVFGHDKNLEDFKKFLLKENNLKTDRLNFVYSESVYRLIETISNIDLLISVNTAVAHIGYALDKKMIILSGPSLDLWIPKGNGICNVTDEEAIYKSEDKWINDSRFASVNRIKTEQVIKALESYGIF